MCHLVCQPIAAGGFHVYINLQLKISNETRLIWGSKACNESKDGYFAICAIAKLLQTEEWWAIKFVTIASNLQLSGGL